MPEENFEEQARRLAEPFSMEPKPAVWQNIKAAIAPQRRRRVLIWWWLLPLCMAGGATVYVLKADSTGKNAAASAVVATPTPKDTFSSDSQVRRKDDDALPEESITSKMDTHAHSSKEKLSENSTEEKQPISLSQTRQSQSSSTTGQKEKGKRIESDDEATKRDTEEDKNRIEASTLAGNTKKERDNGLTNFSQLTQPSETEQRKDTAKEITEPVSDSTDSAKTVDQAPPVAIAKKKAIKKSISIGVSAEIGKASLNSPLSGSNEKSSQAFPAAMSSDYFGLTTGTVTKYKLSNGVDAALGVSAQKRLSGAFTIAAQLTYRYQQFGVAQTIFIDTTNGGNGGGSNNGQTGSGRGIYYPVSAVQRLHLATVYTGVGWQFFTRKHWAASVQAGIDNGFLLSITQKQNGSADSVKSLQTKSFYRWQPSLQFALPVNVYVGKTSRFELSPFVRFGVRRFQKSNASYEGNRLSSAGIGAIYFFK